MYSGILRIFFIIIKIYQEFKNERNSFLFHFSFDIVSFKEINPLVDNRNKLAKGNELLKKQKAHEIYLTSQLTYTKSIHTFSLLLWRGYQRVRNPRQNWCHILNKMWTFLW